MFFSLLLAVCGDIRHATTANRPKNAVFVQFGLSRCTAVHQSRLPVARAANTIDWDTRRLSWMQIDSWVNPIRLPFCVKIGKIEVFFGRLPGYDGTTFSEQGRFSRRLHLRVVVHSGDLLGATPGVCLGREPFVRRPNVLIWVVSKK